MSSLANPQNAALKILEKSLRNLFGSAESTLTAMQNYDENNASREKGEYNNAMISDSIKRLDLTKKLTQNQINEYGKNQLEAAKIAANTRY